MLEFIVPFINKAAAEKFDRCHGTNGELVRCKNCKYSDVIYDTTSDTMPLKCLNIRYGGVQPDWYCEHGERRDEDEADRC